jgi:reverse transcriptase-like protein
MGSLARQASLGLATRVWPRINWAACHRRARSLQRRIVQAVQAGAWRQVKRLSSLLVHSLAGRAFAVKRVTEKAGKKTPGVDGDLWNTPAKKANAVARIGRWQGYRSAPLRAGVYPQEKRPATPAVDPNPDRPGTASGLSPGVAPRGRDDGGPALLRRSAHASVRGGHRPGFQGPAAAKLRHLDLGRGYPRVVRSYLFVVDRRTHRQE